MSALTLSADQDWAAKWPGTPGFYAIGSHPIDAEECRQEGAEIVVVSRAEAVAGHREFLDWNDARRAALELSAP